MAESNIESLLKEQRVFKPSRSFPPTPMVRSMSDYESLAKAAQSDPEKFWAGIASELHWFHKWHTVLEWELSFAKWFVGG
jgi:acetyl-CoA synthetase